MSWETIRRPGYFGKRRIVFKEEWDALYGINGWRVAYSWCDTVISRDFAIILYEDAYYEFFKSNIGLLNWLLMNASDVYDTNVSNVNSKIDYNIQETDNAHIHDIAIRRVVLRLGKTFKGDHLVHIRGENSEGYELNPGKIPFHLQDFIYKPRLKGWWNVNSIEDFFQSNKLLQLKK